MTSKARSEDAKQARLSAILDAARRLFEDGGFEAVTMAQIAREAGLAKGTLYLYCRSKEEVFLALMGEAFADWFGALRTTIAAPAAVRLVDFGRGFARTAADRPELRRLIAILHTALERNATEDILLPFKLWLRDELGALGHALEARYGLGEGEGAEYLIEAYALLIGFAHLDWDTPAVRRLLARADLVPLRIDFETGLAAALDRLAAGYATGRTTTPSDRSER